MKTVVRNRYLWVLIGIWLSYWVWGPWIDADTRWDILIALVVSICLGLLLSYGAALIATFRVPIQKVDAGHFLVIAIFATTYGIVGTFGYRWLGFDRDVLHGAFLWVMVTGLGMKLVTIGAINGRIPRENFVRLGVYASIGLFLAMLATWLVHG